ncbi:hypothetical protein CSOJ01_12010 [Colletotrichum sojae]|uniref:Uncharacterized protein n=1 Tax=Colletotrichum sojae TaxID=2175907 RepID=A0A8H6IVX9_9PEZI|nr:hypothetical protein CSOJ01_12010 [Colletotrichum sojae]
MAEKLDGEAARPGSAPRAVPVPNSMVGGGTRASAETATEPIQVSVRGQRAAATRPAPAPRTVFQLEMSVKDYQTFISFIFSVAIFGASTFAVLASQMQNPDDLWKPDKACFNLRTVRNFLGIAWLCFVLTIALAGYSSSLLTVLRQRGGDTYEGSWGKQWDGIGIFISAYLHVLLVTAFMFLSLALVAYVGTVGWVAVGLNSVASLFVVGLSIYQCRRYFVAQ